MTSEFDILIKNGRIIDGSGSNAFLSDCAIRKGSIAAISSKLELEAKSIIDANGLVVCPGFIDVHSHSDTALPFDNSLSSTLMQGITTSVVGNCGLSLAPVNEERLDLIRKEMDLFSPPGVTLDISWRSFVEYLNSIEKGGISSNIIPLVGFGAIRIAGGPAYENRAPTRDELLEMRQYAQEAMDAGAFGMSTGLIYPPQVYASTDEIIDVARVIGQNGGLYFSHIRGEGEFVVRAVQEVIDIVEGSGCVGGQIAHHKVAGKQFWGLSRETLRLIAEANARGISITCDQYPYNRGSTSLISVLPPWVHEGGVSTLLERISNGSMQKRIIYDIETKTDWENMVRESGWEKIFISSVKTDKWRDTEGLNLAEIARNRNYSDEYEMLFEMLSDEQGEVAMTMEMMGDDDIERIMRSEYTMIGTDGAGISPTGILSFGKPHPRHYGTYPRILGRYVREKGVLGLEEAIHKMTGFPANRLGLTDRGILREGAWADIVVFDPKKVIDTSTYLDPHRFPIGIHFVIVNGIIVAENGKQHEAFPGRVIRRNNSVPAA